MGSRLVPSEDPKLPLIQEWKIDSWNVRSRSSWLSSDNQICRDARFSWLYSINISNWPEGYESHDAMRSHDQLGCLAGASFLTECTPFAMILRQMRSPFPSHQSRLNNCCRLKRRSVTKVSRTVGICSAHSAEVPFGSVDVKFRRRRDSNSSFSPQNDDTLTSKPMLR
jgi:hypothetical protein